MKGAMADPEVSTISTPNNKSTMMTGVSQNFFRTLKKAQRSLRNSIINIVFYFTVADSHCKVKNKFNYQLDHNLIF